jgi:serine/threonine protein kinase
MSEDSRQADAARTAGAASELPCFGNWQTVALIGEGPWSRVYRARPKAAGTAAPCDYAIKVARAPEGGEAALARQLLAREASIGRAVTHPHLVSILAAQGEPTAAYVVMPYLEGATIEAAIQPSRRLSTATALWVARQVAEALAALHEHGWVHTDVKPDNVFLSPDGHVTLIDLGLAQRIGWAELDRVPLAGTLAYSPPEWFSPVAELTPASDVYGLGVTLYRLLTGRLPFPDRDPAALAQAHLHRMPPEPRRFNPRLCYRIVRLLRRMLAKQPCYRPELTPLRQELLSLEIENFDERFAA